MGCPAALVKTQFLGAYISSFNASIGWNGAQGSLDAILVEDDCGGGIAYGDYGNGASYIPTDSNFNPPPLGYPVIFRYGTFRFGGFLQNWKESDSASGAKTYSVRIIDPQNIVDGTQVILNGYIGNTFDAPNLVNVYGWLEHNLGALCTEMTTFGTYPPFGFNILLRYIPASGFGGVDHWDGLPWWQIRLALSYLLNQNGDNFGSKITYRDHLYNFDLSEISALSNDIRFSDDSMSLGELIAQVCEYSSCDYFYELVNNDTIKVRVIDRKEQSNDNNAWLMDLAVSTNIDNRLNIGTISGTLGGISGLESRDRGLELRDAYTNAFLTGEYRQDIWQIDRNLDATNIYNANIWPYWGKDNNNNVILSYGIDNNDFITNHYFDVDVSTWGIPGLSGIWRITSTELRYALEGETQWRNFVLTRQPNLVHTLHFAAENKLPDVGTFYYAALNGGYILPKDLVAASSNDAIAAVQENEAWQRIEQIYKNILQYAQTFFGKKFLVKLPYLCIKAATDTPYTIEKNWVPARDGGWYEGTVLGLSPGSAMLEHFRQDDGKIVGFVGFESSRILDMSAINNNDDYIQPNPFTAYVKCNVEDIVQVYPGDWRAVISLPGPVYNFAPDPDVNIILGMWGMAVTKYGGSIDKKKFKKLADRIGSDKVKYSISPLFLMPNKAAVPLQSTRLVYGPWAATVGDLSEETTSSAGRTDYQRSTDFAPWNFNGMANMNDAANAYIYGRLSTHYVTEQGYISVPDAPTVNLGEALFSGGPLVTNININMQGGQSPVTTNYTMRTYTPDYGKLAQQYINAIKRNGVWSRKSQRMFRLWTLNKFRTQFDQVYGFWRYNIKRAVRYTTTSSHDILLAENIIDPETTSGYRSNVAIGELRKNLPEIRRDDYTSKAVMDLNGIFRPFSTKELPSGSGDMATFEDSQLSGGYASGSLDNISLYYSKEQLPPVNNEKHLPIVMETLSPFLSKDMVDTYLLGTSKGHDIEYVARDGVYPAHLSVRHPSDNYSSEHWYRGVALKGPLVIAGWGYDIDNKPVPNASPNYPNNPQLEFTQDWLRKPHMWKCGPVDLRWDYNRKVWTSPPSMKMVQLKVVGTLLPNGENTVKAILLNEPTQYDRDGTIISNEVYVRNAVPSILTSGMQAVAYYDTHDEEYYVVGPTTPTPFKLAENHPGRGIPFNIYLGTPNLSANEIIYDSSTTYTAIDFRYGTPTPSTGATGEGVCTSFNGGWRLRVIDIDCETPS